ncbi:MAG: DUF1761 domain-containing protein [Verrucomicrobia bacterium]|nr:DUF1761 domain-containing protein [Verrucomicrobiota bacterium]
MKTVLAALAYVVVSFALAAPWHFVLFKDLYHSFGIYNRADPIIPLGLLSMIVQGAVMAALYPRWYRGGAPAVEGIKFGLLMGVFLFSVSTLANAAKIEVKGLGGFLAVQAVFHLLQFVAAGAAVGLVFGRLPAKAA